MKTAVTIADADNITRGDIFDLEDAYVSSIAAIPRDDRSGVFHPSAIGMCPRRNVYEYIHTKAIKTIDPDDSEIFSMGHLVHDMVQTTLERLPPYLKTKDINFEFTREVPYDPEKDNLLVDFGLGGTCDGVLKVWTPHWAQRGIVEIKSIGDKGYHALNGPKKDHIMQAHLYAYRFDCPLMWLWYLNKNTSRRRVYPVIFDRSILMEALHRVEDQLAHAAAGTLPDREESWYMCPRCQYRDICKPSTAGKVARKSHNKKMSNIRKKGIRR